MNNTRFLKRFNCKIAFFVFVVMLTFNLNLGYASDDLANYKNISITIEDWQYNYEIRECYPPIKIEYFSDGGIYLDSAINALRSIYTQVENKSWDGFRQVWIDYDVIYNELKAQFDIDPPSPEEYFSEWEKVLKRPNYIRYIILFNEYTMFVKQYKVYDNGELVWRFSPSVFKKANGKYYKINKEFLSDKLFSSLSDIKFDPYTGSFDPPSNAKIDIRQNEWNIEWLKDDAKGQGKIQCYIGNISGHSVEEIDVKSILLDNVVPVGLEVNIVSHPDFQGQALKIMFNKFDAIKTLGAPFSGQEYDIVITGRLANGKMFQGSDKIRIK